MKDMRLDHGLTCYDDIARAGPPGTANGTTLCDMCCRACEEDGQLCSDPPPAMSRNPSPPEPRVDLAQKVGH